MRLAQRYHLRLTQLVSSIILVMLLGGYGSAKSVLDRFITVGRSDRGSTRASVQAQAELLHDVLSSLGVDKPSLVGHSWGAALALAYALKYSHEVSGLVLLAPAVYPDETGNNLLAAIARTPVIGDLSVAIGKTVLGRRVLERGLATAFFPERVPDPYLKLAYSLWLSRKRVKAYVEDESSLNFSLNKMSKHYAEIRNEQGAYRVNNS